MTQRCPVGGELYGPEATLCPEHICALEPHASGPGGDGGQPPTGAGPETGNGPEPGRGGREPAGDRQKAAAWTTATCWNCGTPPPSETSTECLDPDCRRSLTPPALLVVFAYGQVEVEPGGRAELGRHGAHGRLFRPYPNVSRRHAIVGVDPDGRAWITPLRTPNGTFLNGDEIEPVRQQPLASGDRVRLARDAEGSVRLFHRQRDRSPR